MEAVEKGRASYCPGSETQARQGITCLNYLARHGSKL